MPRAAVVAVRRRSRHDHTSPYVYPTLSPLPTYTRPSAAQAKIPPTGTNLCNIYYPGQYDTALTLASGTHYFASGVYYFTSTVTLQPGAKVVAGEGKFPGCAVDAEAAFAQGAPRSHSISGKGATFVFGGAGKLISDNASLEMNRRVSDATTRASEGISIRSVNFGPTPPTTTLLSVQIPNDAVTIANVYDASNPLCSSALSTTQCLQPASSHTVQATSSSPIRSFVSSTLTTTDAIVQVNQTSGSAATNQFVADGYVFVPNAKVVLNGGSNANYRLQMSGGVVASAVNVGYSKMPSTSSDWFFGVISKPKFLEVNLTTTVTAPNGQRTISRATLQVNGRQNYAIKGWTVDPNAGSATTVATTPPTVATTPPTVATTPPTVPTTPPTTVPPFPIWACNTSTPTWSNAFGSGTWNAEFWNLSSFSGSSPSNPFNGSPNYTYQPTAVSRDHDASPIAGVNADYFSARFTKSVSTTQACTIDIQGGGDDGIRVKIDGVTVVDDWDVHSFRYKETTGATVPVGNHTIVVEFFERAGQARYDVQWRKL
jgi:PA14 domain